MTETSPARTVSNDDRRAALAALREHGVDVPRFKQAGELACTCGVLIEDPLGHKLDVLAAHGWAPRPVISKARIIDYAAVVAEQLGGATAPIADAIRRLLRELEIDVCEHRANFEEENES